MRLNTDLKFGRNQATLIAEAVTLLTINCLEGYESNENKGCRAFHQKIELL